MVGGHCSRQVLAQHIGGRRNKALVGEKDNMREKDISTGNEAVDKVAQAIGSIVAPLVLMSQVGRPSLVKEFRKPVASNPALWNVSPSVLSALRSAATGFDLL